MTNEVVILVLKIVEGQEAGGGSEGRCGGAEDAAEERMEGKRGEAYPQ